VETISDYFPQPRAVNAIDSRIEHGRGHVYASDVISRHIPRVCGYWAPAYTFRRFFLVDLVPAVALTFNDASLSCPIFEHTISWLIT
jgi:hypothetical protein